MHSDIVIVGGGAGGLELAARLGRSLGAKQGRERVLLVDRSPFHIWKPTLHEVAAGTLDVHQEGLSYPRTGAAQPFRLRHRRPGRAGRRAQDHRAGRDTQRRGRTAGAAPHGELHPPGAGHRQRLQRLRHARHRACLPAGERARCAALPYRLAGRLRAGLVFRKPGAVDRHRGRGRDGRGTVRRIAGSLCRAARKPGQQPALSPGHHPGRRRQPHPGRPAGKDLRAGRSGAAPQAGAGAHRHARDRDPPRRPGHPCRGDPGRHGGLGRGHQGCRRQCPHGPGSEPPQPVHRGRPPAHLGARRAGF